MKKKVKVSREVEDLIAGSATDYLRSRKKGGTSGEKVLVQRERGSGPPPRRPQIGVRPLAGQPFAVDCPELRWWFVVPELGQEASFATYEPPDWDLVRLERMRVVRRARIHGVEGVEIRGEVREDSEDWQLRGLTFARLTREAAQYLAVELIGADERVLQTFLDEGFASAWGDVERRLADDGRFRTEADGTLRQVSGVGDTRASGAGVFEVAIGPRRFECLRVLELEGEVTDPDAPLTESYLTRQGRTVLRRHYCHDAHPQLALDRGRQIVLDGEVFVHWHDNLTAEAWESVPERGRALAGAMEEALEGGRGGTAPAALTKAEQPQTDRAKVRQLQPA